MKFSYHKMALLTALSVAPLLFAKAAWADDVTSTSDPYEVSDVAGIILQSDNDNGNFGQGDNMSSGNMGGVEGVRVMASGDSTVESSGEGTSIYAYNSANQGSSSPAASLTVNASGSGAGTVAIVGATSITGTESATSGISSGVANSSSGSLSVYSASSGSSTFSVAGVTGNTSVGGTLGVTGATTLNGGATIWGTSASTGAEAQVSGNAATLTSGNASNSLVVNNTGTAITGLESVSGNFSANGATNNIGTTQNSANNIGTFGTSSTTIGSTSASAGNVTLQSTSSNNLIVGQTQTTTVGVNSLSYGTQVNGGLLVNGSLGVNGNIYSLNPTANASVNVANNGLSITGATNTVTLTANNTNSLANSGAQLAMTPSDSSLLVTNTDTGVQHGIRIGQTDTVISGGTHSTSLTLDDNGATFADDQTGGAAQVHGVAAGTAPTDAVNVSQLSGVANRAYAGVASAEAMANIPNPAPGKDYAIGAAYGNYSDQDAMAIGVKAVVGKARNITLSASYAYADQISSVGAGVAYSF